MQINPYLPEARNYLLTIAIPTYNRADCLALSLKRIFEEITNLDGHLSNLVKVYVSNNASTDDTSDVLLKYKHINNQFFEVVNNIENMGADWNVLQCYKSANTPYVWILGDDDVILAGGLQLVLDLLYDNSPDVIYLEGYSFFKNYLDEPKRGKRKGVIEYDRALDFVKYSHIRLTFLTALIVRSGVDQMAYSNLLDGSKLGQLGWIFPIIRDGKKFVVLRNRVYAAREGASGGYDPVEVFGKNLIYIAKNIFEKQPELAEVIKNSAIVSWFPFFILNYKKGTVAGEYLLEDVSKQLRIAFNDNWRYYFFISPLIRLPVNLAQLYYKCIRFFRLIFKFFLI
jgi:abequosyltransferase